MLYLFSFCLYFFFLFVEPIWNRSVNEDWKLIGFVWFFDIILIYTRLLIRKTGLVLTIHTQTLSHETARECEIVTLK